jgi:hypothetical protein
MRRAVTEDWFCEFLTSADEVKWVMSFTLQQLYSKGGATDTQ